MKKPPKMPTSSKMVDEFDTWLVNYVPKGLEKAPIDIIKDITGRWRSLKKKHIDDLMSWFDEVMNNK